MLYAKKYLSQKNVKKIFVFLEMLELSKIATNIDVDILNFKKILKLIKFYKIDLVISWSRRTISKRYSRFFKKK